MSYEGPLPDEALPIGEDTLLPDELARVAEVMFRGGELADEAGLERITEADVSPPEWAAIQGAGDLLRERDSLTP